MHYTDELIDDIVNSQQSKLYEISGSYSCSAAPIDKMVDIALSVDGVKGAQIAGAGLGGCIMVLVKNDAFNALNEKLEEEIRKLKGLTKKKIPIFTFSQIKDIDLESVVNIEQNFDNSIFDEWLNCDIKMKKRDIVFLEKLLIKNQNLIKHYNEEDLKIHFLTPIFFVT
jgi:hypothetical protein